MSRLEINIEADGGGAAREVARVKREVDGVSSSMRDAERSAGGFNASFANMSKAAPGAGRALSQVEQGVAGVGRSAGLSASQVRIVTIAVRTLTGALGPITIALGAAAAGLALFQRRQESAREETERLAQAQRDATQAAEEHAERMERLQTRTVQQTEAMADLRLRILDVVDAERALETRQENAAAIAARLGVSRLESVGDLLPVLDAVNASYTEESERLRILERDLQGVEEMRDRMLSQNAEMFDSLGRQVVVLQRERDALRESTAELEERREALSDLLSLQKTIDAATEEGQRSRQRGSDAARDAARAEREAARLLAEREREYQEILRDRERLQSSNLSAMLAAQQVSFAAMEEEMQLEHRRQRLARAGIEEVSDLRRFASEASIRLMMAETDEQRAQIEQQIADYQEIIAARDRAEQAMADRRLQAISIIDAAEESLLSEEERRARLLDELRLGSFDAQVDAAGELYAIREALAAAEEEEEIERLERRAQLWQQFHAEQVRVASDAAAERARVEEEAARRREQLVMRAADRTAAAISMAAEEGLAATLHQVGGELQADGTRNLLRAAAMSILSPGSGAALAGIGSAQLASGTAMRAGGSVPGAERGVAGGTVAPAGSGSAGPTEVNTTVNLSSLVMEQGMLQQVGEAVTEATRRGMIA